MISHHKYPSPPPGGEGELVSELKDGRRFILRPGVSFQVSDFGDSPHRSVTETGAKLFIVD